TPLPSRRLPRSKPPSFWSCCVRPTLRGANTSTRKSATSRAWGAPIASSQSSSMASRTILNANASPPRCASRSARTPRLPRRARSRLRPTRAPKATARRSPNSRWSRGCAVWVSRRSSIDRLIDLLKDSEQKLETAVQKGGDSPKLRHCKAQTLIHFADGHRTLGDTEQSLKRAKEASSLLERLVESQPRELAWRQDLMK